MSIYLQAKGKMNQKQTLNSSQQICFDSDRSQQFRNYFQNLLSKYILCVYTSYIFYTKLCCTMLSRSVISNSLRPHGLQPASLLCPWGFSKQEYWSGLPQGKPRNTGVGSLALLQGIFPTQELNRGSPASQVDSLPTELSGKPKRGLLSSNSNCKNPGSVAHWLSLAPDQSLN